MDKRFLDKADEYLKKVLPEEAIIYEKWLKEGSKAALQELYACVFHKKIYAKMKEKNEYFK